MKALRELSAWPVPLNIKTPVFRLNTRSYYGVRQLAHELGAENELSCTLKPGTDGDVSMVEHLQTRPEALRVILMDPLANSHVPADGKADGYVFGNKRGFPCFVNGRIIVSPKAFPVCGQHDYCQYCLVPCYAGESFEKHADGTFALREIQGDRCLTAQIRMELCLQIEQGIDPLGGKSIEECLAAQPVEKVPVFRKRIKI